ncbi:MAG: thiolase family protein [Promethearchaeota archaeon]
MAISDKIYIVGMGMIKCGKQYGKNVKALTGMSLQNAFDDCGLERSDIEAAWFSNTGWGMSIGQDCIRGEVALTANGIDKIPINNVENACASASNALHNAWISIKAGLFDCCLAVGTEKMRYKPENIPSTTRAGRGGRFGGFLSGTDIEKSMKLIEQIKEETKKKNIEDAKKKGKDAKNAGGDHSVFMDFYAAGAREHMRKYGSTQRQLAAIASKNHNNSTMNPLSQYTFPQTIEQVMNDYVVAYPLTRAMCAPIGDGSATAIICSEKYLKEQHPELKDRAVLIRASVLRSGSLQPDNINKRLADAAYAMSGLGPDDIDFCEVHDATAYAELHNFESLGLCKLGEGGKLAEEGYTQIGGKLPVNTSGGLECRGHPIGATGLAQIYELVIQLRHEAGKRQVENAQIGLAQNAGGTIGNGEAAGCVHILERV